MSAVTVAVVVVADDAADDVASAAELFLKEARWRKRGHMESCAPARATAHEVARKELGCRRTFLLATINGGGGKSAN